MLQYSLTVFTQKEIRNAFVSIKLRQLAVLSVRGWAQTAQPAPPALPQAPQPIPAPAPQSQQYVPVDYSKPRSQFPNVIAPYKPGYVPPPNLNNTDRVQQLMRDGKIMLSMNDAVALALENNLDIEVQRYGPRGRSSADPPA